MREVEQKNAPEAVCRITTEAGRGLLARSCGSLHAKQGMFFCITVPRGPFQVRSAHLWLPCPTVIFPAAPEAETGGCNYETATKSVFPVV